MGGAGTRVQKDNRQVDHKAEPSNEEVRSKIAETQNEMKNASQSADQQNSIGLFQKFVNWIKGIFSRDNKPNLEPGATEKGNMPANTKVNANNTLSPEITGSDLPRLTADSTAAPKTEQNAAPKLPDTPDTQTAGLNETSEPKSVSREDIVERLESAVSVETALDAAGDLNDVIDSETGKVSKESSISEKSEKAAATEERSVPEESKKAAATEESSVSEESEKAAATEESSTPEEGEKAAATEESSTPEESEKAAAAEESSTPEESEKAAAAEESSAPEEDEKPNITERIMIGNMEFDIFKLGEYTFAQSGKLSILGRRVWWETDERINLIGNNETGYFGAGVIKFKDENLFYNGKAEFLIKKSKIKYFFDEGLYYVQDGIKIDLGKGAEDLNEFKLNEVSLLNYKAKDDSTMKGNVTINNKGFNDSAERDLVWFPSYLFNTAKIPKLKLAADEGQKLNFSLVSSDNKVSFGIEKVAELESEDPVTAEVLEDGTIVYSTPKNYSVDILGVYKNNFEIEPVKIESGQETSTIHTPKFDFGVDDIALSQVSLNLSVGKKDKGGSISAEKITYKSLTINNLSGEIGENGVSANVGGFSFSIGDKELSGSIGGFKWETGKKTFSVLKLELGVDKIAFSDNISIKKGDLQLSLNDGKFSFAAAGTLNIDKLQNGWIGIDTNDLKLNFALSEKSELSASADGKIKFWIGKGQPIVESEAENISYDNGIFEAGTLSLTTTFDKLFSGKFSGSATLTASGLKISGKDEKDFNLDSITLGINGLAYNSKTLVKSAEAAVIFKDDQKEENPVTADGELDVGNASGALTGGKIAFYLLENQKGVKLTADKFNPVSEYLEMDLTNISAEFYKGDGENEISVGSCQLKSGKKFKDILGADSFSLGVSNCKITSNGIQFQNVEAAVENLKIANALTLNNLGVKINFDDKMAFESFEIKSSATLGGSIGITDLFIKANNKGEAELTAAKILCDEKLRNLEISNVSGSFSNKKADVKSANFAFSLAKTELSGSLEGLSWSGESDFSVEKFTVEVSEIAVNDSLSVEGGKITASLKNNIFEIGAEATLKIKDMQKGIVKIAGTDLTLALNLSDEKGEGDKMNIKAGGSAKGELGIEIGDNIVSGKIKDIEYNDGEFSVETFSIGADLGKLGNEKLGGKGEISVEKFKFKNGETPSFGKMELKVSEITYNGKPLISDVSVGVFLDDEVKDKEGGAEEEKATADNATLALEDDLEGDLSGLDISVYLTDSFKGVKIDAKSFSVTPGDFAFNFDSFKGEFSKGNCKIDLGQATIESDLSKNKIAKTLGIENLTFGAKDVSINNGQFSVGNISARAETDLNICGFTVKNAEVDMNFEKGMKFKDFKIGGELGYKNYISGRASVKVDKEGEVFFEEVSNINVSYGCFSGSLNSIEKDGEKVTFNKLKLAKKTDSEGGGEAGFEGEDSGSLFAKFLRTVPDIAVTISELTFENGALKKPSLDDISINRLEKEFTLGSAVRAIVKYSGDDEEKDGKKGTFTVGVNGGISMPKSGEEEKKFPFLKAKVPIIMPFLNADFELGFTAGINAKFGFSATAERNDKELNLNTNINAKARGSFGFYGSAAISADAVIASIKGGVELGLKLKANMDLQGDFGLTYDPSAETFFKSFKIDKEKTSLGFELNSDLNFNVKLFGELKGLPIIPFFNEKKLYHSWDLFNYKLMGANIKGSITYDQKEGKYKFDADPRITNAGKFDNYSPQKTEDTIKDFGNSLEELESGMNEVDKLLKKAYAGVNPNKGSLNEIEGELGDKVQGAKETLMPQLKQRIDNIFKSSRESSMKCHITMVELRKMIEDNAKKLVENERNVERLEKVVEESRTALDIVGYKPDEGGGMTKDKYIEFIRSLEQLKEDNKRIEKLALLEPAAVINMFKAFKLKDTKSWSELQNTGNDLTEEQTVGAAPAEAYQAKINTRIYGTAMNDLAKLLRNKQNAIDKQKKNVEDALKALNNARDAKAALETKVDEKLKILDKQAEEIEPARLAAVAAEEKMCSEAVRKENEKGKIELAKISKDNTKKISTAKKAQEAANKKAENLRESKKVRLNDATRVMLMDAKEGKISKTVADAYERARAEMEGDPNNRLELRYKMQELVWKDVSKQIEQFEKEEEEAKKAAQKAYDGVVSAANSRTEKQEKATQSAVTEIETRSEENIKIINKKAAAALKNITAQKDAESERLKQETAKVTVAERRHEEAVKMLDMFNEQMANTEDISSAMVGFQGFISVEYSSTKKAVRNLRQSYGVGKSGGKARTEETAKPPAVDMDKRKQNVINIIDRVIQDANSVDLDKKLDSDEKLKRHNDRLKTIQEGSGIVDKNMKGYGLSGLNSITSFNTMMADNKKFQTIQKQLDTIYQQLSSFHRVIEQALKSWNKVNDINFKETKTAADFSGNSSQVVKLINNVNTMEEKQIKDDNLGSLSNEVERLGNIDDGSLRNDAETAAPPDQMKKESDLLSVS